MLVFQHWPRLLILAHPPSRYSSFGLSFATIAVNVVTVKANDVLIGRVDSDTTIPAKIRLTIGAVNLSSGGNVTILPNVAGLGGDLLIQNAKSSIVSGQSIAIGDATNRAVNAFVSGVFTAAADLRIATLDGLSVSGKITSTGGSIRLAPTKTPMASAICSSPARARSRRRSPPSTA